LNINLGVQITFFLAVDHHEIQPVLKSLQRGADGRLRVHLLLEIRISEIDLSLFEGLFDPRRGKDARQPPRFLALYKGFHLGLYDTGDNLAQGDAALAGPFRRKRDRKIFKKRPLWFGQSATRND
jgi:hypothetical protein